MTTVEATAVVDLRRAPLAAVRGVDFHAPDRDLWSDEAAAWDRLLASWAGLDDAAWHLPGLAPSDAGGPDWSLAEHIGHLADWFEIAIEYTGPAIVTGRWPTDDDYGGDLDIWNEGRREPWASMSRDAILERLHAARPRLLDLARQVGAKRFRSDDAWGWMYMVLHGHYLDHLVVIEPWANTLRRHQVDGDPFVDDPRATDAADFAAQDEAVQRDFDTLIRTLPAAAWTREPVTPGWTVRDHVAHMADWFPEAVKAIEVWEQRGYWMADPEEGVDVWNERHVAERRGEDVRATLARYDSGRARLLEAIGRLPADELRSADGWAWTYDCLHGHLRKHLAMLGPWCASVRWDIRGG